MNTLWRNKEDTSSPAIMESLVIIPHNSPVRQISNQDNSEDELQIPKTLHNKPVENFMLIDKKKRLTITTANQFLSKLNCPGNGTKVKVVSIFGNTGDGKSHTLNHVFFMGKEIFKTSSDQNSCTQGVWAAYDPNLNVICLDTEGLFLGNTSIESDEIRLLLKILIVSDIVLYRTRSERLSKDLYTFLNTASKVYSENFKYSLKTISEREGVEISTSTLGPCIIIFHETRYTKPLSNGANESTEDMLKRKFSQMNLDTRGFSSIKYVGTQTTNFLTNFETLKSTIRRELRNVSIRSARDPSLVFKTLKLVNEGLSEVEFFKMILPEQYFTCRMKCLSCDIRCKNTMGHLYEGIPHYNNIECNYNHQYGNSVQMCKTCYDNGQKVAVSQTETENNSSWYGLAKAWSGYTIECPNCGEIYRSRQFWYGNKNPEDDAVKVEIVHVWKTPTRSAASQNTAQRVVDSVSYLADAVSNVSLEPTKILTAWMSDVVAPSYWRPNSEIKNCYKCKKSFKSTDQKHHCRACGEGFCEACSSRTRPVPSRNWNEPVRVCDFCYDDDSDNIREFVVNPSENVGVRKVSEQVISTLGAVGTVLNYSKTLIKDSARPSYWVPDSEISCCCVCEKYFCRSVTLHHCRDCGRGVCDPCSQHRKLVLHRGWDKPVRVCDACVKLD